MNSDLRDNAPSKQLIHLCGRYFAVVEKYVRNPTTVKANIAVAENIDRSVHRVILRQFQGSQLGRSVPTGMPGLLADDCATHLLFTRAFVALAASGKKSTICHIILRQRISHKNDVICPHQGGAQVALDFLDKRWRPGLE